MIVSDFDGTLVRFDNEPYESSWDEVGKNLKVYKRKKWLTARNKYMGLINQAKTIKEKVEIEKKWFDCDLDLMKGENIQELLKKILPLNYTPGAKEFFYEMQKEKIKTGVLSAGIDFVIKEAVNELGIDFYICAEIEAKSGTITGRGKANNNLQNKLTILKKICQNNRIKLEEVAYFGDNFNCQKCIESSGLGIAINAKSDEIKKAAKYSFENFADAIEIIKKYNKTK
jgi:HAD superfamily phosphoserine phosphatase-like hydrolase